MKDTTNLSIKPITPVPVVRDENGYWTHPEVGSLPGVNFEQEMSMRGMESYYLNFFDDAPKENEATIWYFGDGGLDVRGWNPSEPCGDGWFIASIHETDHGPVCLWLRQFQKEGENE